MFDTGLSPETLGVCLLGVGGSVLGLIGLVAGPWLRGRGRVVLAAWVGLLAALAGTAAVLGQPREIWAAVLILAGVCGLFWAVRAPVAGRLGGRVFAFVRMPGVQWAFLLVVSPLLAVGWACRVDPRDAAAVSQGFGIIVAEEPPLQEVSNLRVETDRGRPVTLFTLPGVDVGAIAATELDVLRDRVRSMSLIRTALPDVESNCHGWVFAGGHYWVRGRDVEAILQDNGYHEVSEPRSGDLVVYRDGRGQVVHTGLVRASWEAKDVLVESKWGWLGRYLHAPDAQSYASAFTFYRSDRIGHALHGLGGETPHEAMPPAPRVERKQRKEKVYAE